MSTNWPIYTLYLNNWTVPVIKQILTGGGGHIPYSGLHKEALHERGGEKVYERLGIKDRNCRPHLVELPLFTHVR